MHRAGAQSVAAPRLRRPARVSPSRCQLVASDVVAAVHWPRSVAKLVLWGLLLMLLSALLVLEWRLLLLEWMLVMQHQLQMLLCHHGAPHNYWRLWQ